MTPPEYSLQQYIELTVRGTHRKVIVKVDSIEAVVEYDTKCMVQVAGQFHKVEQSYEKVKELMGQNIIFRKVNTVK